MYRVFYFDITAENEDYFDGHDLDFNDYALCPATSGTTRFLCMNMDEDEAIMLKLTYPNTTIYPICDT